MKMKKLALIISSALLAINASAASADFVKGIDLTGLSSVTAAQLNQLVDNATVATNRGLVIIQSTTPDTSTYPKLTNYVWIDISAIPYTLKAYTTNSWLAASIGASSVLNGNIADGAVTSNKIASLTIVGTNLAANVITYDKIADGNVTAGKYAAGSITNADIAVNAVQTGNILDQNVTTAKIQDAAITSIKLAAGAIVTTNLAAGSIYGTNIAGNTITQTNIVDQGVGLTNIVRGTATYVPRVNAAGTSLEYVSGGIVGMAYTNIVECLTNAITTPAYDDSIPEVGEGMLLGTLTYTPKYANSIIHIHAVVFACSTGANHATVWAVKDGATSLAVANMLTGGSTYLSPITLDYYESAASLTARTYTLREGGPAATVINGDVTNGRRFGGKLNSTFTVTEILP